MSAQAAALKTSAFTHAYSVTITGVCSPKTRGTGGTSILVRDGDMATCAHHGELPIVGTAAIARDLDSKIFARVGDTVASPCFAVILDGDPKIQLS